MHRFSQIMFMTFGVRMLLVYAASVILASAVMGSLTSCKVYCGPLASIARL